MRNVSDKVCRKNQITHFLYNNFFFQKSWHLWDDIEKYCEARKVTDDVIIPCMRFVFWITKATNSHSEYVTLLAFPREKNGFANESHCHVMRTLLFTEPRCIITRLNKAASIANITSMSLLTYSHLHKIYLTSTCTRVCTQQDSVSFFDAIITQLLTRKSVVHTYLHLHLYTFFDVNRCGKLTHF